MPSFILNTFLFYASIKWTYSSACEHHSHQHDDLAKHHYPETTDELFSDRNLEVHQEVESCGFEEPTQEQVAMDQVLMYTWSSERVGADSSIDYTIPTYFHFLQYNSSDLFLSDTNVNTYMNYLNTAFNKSNAPFRFSLRGITRTINATWSNNCRDSNNQLAYKTLLRRGGKETLNIYVCNTIPAGPNGGFITGFATLPSANPGVTDGVNIVRSTPTDLQRQNTLVHEVGHFLGLLHTFKDNCTTTNNGDLVDDTPYHISLASTVNCKTSPTTWDTCPTLPGLDPVDNYMTYTTDNHGCRTRFSPGQVARMIAQFEIYRYTAPTQVTPVSAPLSVPAPIAPSPIAAPRPVSAPRPIIAVNPVFEIAQSTAPVPVATAPTASGTCKQSFKPCKSNSACCSGKCQVFLGNSSFRKRCV